jgi:hypothetical protein
MTETKENLINFQTMAQMLQDAKEKGKQSALQCVKRWCNQHLKEFTEQLEQGYLVVQLKYTDCAKELNIHCPQEWRQVSGILFHTLQMSISFFDSEKRTITVSQMNCRNELPEWVELYF